VVNARKVTAGLAESNVSLLPGGWLKVTCGLIACTPGSAPGPTLGNDMGKLLFYQAFNHFLPETCLLLKLLSLTIYGIIISVLLFTQNILS